MTTCAVDGCESKRYCRGWCTKHYNRWFRLGDPHANFYDTTPAERFGKYVQETDGCWLWTGGSSSRDGYGRFYANGKKVLAHRFAYELSNGPIPDGMVIDHMCFTRACVNPSHLRCITQKQNSEHRSGAQVNNKSSGIRGVTWDKQSRKWHAQVRHNGHNWHVGQFDSIDDAEAAVIKRRLELFTHNDLDRQAG